MSPNAEQIHYSMPLQYVTMCATPPCRYLAGGIETGFRKGEKDKYEPRLLHVKGRRNIRVQQVRGGGGGVEGMEVMNNSSSVDQNHEYDHVC